VGATLLLVGLLGFIADGSFDTAGSADTDRLGNANGELQGDSFLGFEVNGWHNLVHIASGLLLLSVFRNRKAAKTVALVFGVLYGIVTLIGLIDGNDVLGLFPVNPADNILHIALTAAALLAAFASDGDDRDDNRTSTSTTGYGTSSGTTGTRTEGDVDSLTGAPRETPR